MAAEREFYCKCCDSDEEHLRWEQESMHEFLRNPGPPPPHFSEEDVSRARRSMADTRKKLGMEGGSSDEG